MCFCRATLPLTDTKELLSPDCLCSHSSNLHQQQLQQQHHHNQQQQQLKHESSNHQSHHNHHHQNHHNHHHHNHHNDHHHKYQQKQQQHHHQHHCSSSNGGVGSAATVFFYSGNGVGGNGGNVGDGGGAGGVSASGGCCGVSSSSSSNAMTDLSNFSGSSSNSGVTDGAATESAALNPAICCTEKECTECVFTSDASSCSTELNQNGQQVADDSDAASASPRRHSSMDQLMGLLNDMGKSSRTRSLSDGHDEGLLCIFYSFIYLKISKWSY